MAYQKNKTVKGYDANYWRLDQLNINITRLAEGVDANTTFLLYKDRATRDADDMNFIDQFSIELGTKLMGKIPANAGDNIRNISLAGAYKTLKELAITESAKPAEEQATDLAFFADAVEV